MISHIPLEESSADHDQVNKGEWLHLDDQSMTSTSDYSDYSDSDDDDDDEMDAMIEDHELDTLEAFVHRVLPLALRVQSSPDLKALAALMPSCNGSSTLKKARGNQSPSCFESAITYALPDALLSEGVTRKKPRICPMPKSESAVYLSQTNSRSAPSPVACVEDIIPMKPDDYLKSLLQKRGLLLENFEHDEESYLDIKQQNLVGYPQAALAARKEDLSELQRLYSEGSNLQCCNNFGESIVHIVCRRGNSDLLKFLTDEVQVSIRLRDDVGRTPLHDAAWTDKPNFELVSKLLSNSPDFLLVKDKRNHTALAYVPKQQWGDWCHYLDSHQQFLDDAINSKFVRYTTK